MESTGLGHGSVAGCHEPPLTIRFLLHFIRMVFRNDCESLSSSLCNFLHHPSKVHIFTASLNSSSLNVMGQVPHPYKTHFVTAAVVATHRTAEVSTPALEPPQPTAQGVPRVKNAWCETDHSP